MTWLYVLLGIILFFAFLLSLKIKLRVKYKGGDLVYSLTILGIKLKRHPIPEYNKPINYRKFTYKKHKKRIKKERELYLEAMRAERSDQKAKTAEKTARPDQKKSAKRSKTEGLSEALGFVWIFIKNFVRRLHVKIIRLKVNVADGDAAKTAIKYGAAVQSVNYFIEFLGNVAKLDKIEKADLGVNADYTGNRTTLDLYFIFHLRVCNIVGLVFSVVFDFVKKLASGTPRPSGGSPFAKKSTPKNKGSLKTAKKPSASKKSTPKSNKESN